MKIMDRKGQGAMEYLMTYGWAILVVMIVGVVLWQLGIFGGGPGAVNTATGFSKIKPMEPSIRYTSSGLDFTIVNGAGTTIEFLNISASDVNGACGTTNLRVIPSLRAGETHTVTNLTQAAYQCTVLTSGAAFSVDITFTYNQTVGGIGVSHSESGILKGAVE